MWALTLYRSTIGKKMIMAVTGLVLVVFVIGHMAGNLQQFLGPEKMNHPFRVMESLVLRIKRPGAIVTLEQPVIPTRKK